MFLQVRARNAAGFGPYSRPTAFRTKSASSSIDARVPPGGSNIDKNISQDGTNETEPSTENDHFILAIVVATSCVFLILATLMLCYKRRRRQSNSLNSKKYPVYDNTTGKRYDDLLTSSSSV